tara:strand:- start:369 stop:1058 length:690 start_codon:yes stop_codon:yes gene_type:complete
MSILKMQSLPQSVVKAHDVYIGAKEETEKALAQLEVAERSEKTATGQLYGIFKKRGMTTPMHFVSPSTNPDCQITQAVYDDLLALCKTTLPAETQWLIDASDEDIIQRCVDQGHEGAALIAADKAMRKARTNAKKQPQSALKDLKTKMMRFQAKLEEDKMTDDDKLVNEHNNAIDKDIERLSKMSKNMDQRITGDNAEKIVADCQKAISGLIGALNASKIVDPIPTTKH